MRDKKGQTGGQWVEKELEKKYSIRLWFQLRQGRGKNRIRERPLINLVQLVPRKSEEGGKKLLS